MHDVGDATVSADVSTGNLSTSIRVCYEQSSPEKQISKCYRSYSRPRSFHRNVLLCEAEDARWRHQSIARFRFSDSSPLTFFVKLTNGASS